MADGKPGPRQKGTRSCISLRIPAEHRLVYEHMQVEGGYQSLNDYLTAVLADLHQLPTPQYIKVDEVDPERPPRAMQDRLFSNPAA